MTSWDGNDILRENGWETSEDFRRLAFPSQLGNLLMEVITALRKTEFGLSEDFRIYTLQNANGLRVKITNCGAAVMEVHAPDRAGNLADLALGFGDCAGYLENVPSLGVVVGRYANRIANGTFNSQWSALHFGCESRRPSFAWRRCGFRQASLARRSF